jgi:hypothetical protein|tara:strand:+ start:3332 stop:3823 length:492 start_codon:yes stop_codon:yes gene_type:complete
MATNKKKEGKVNQTGLFNLNAQFNFFSSGGAAATGSIGTQVAGKVVPQALKGLAKTGVGQSIPIVGQVLTLAMAGISIAQMFQARDEAKVQMAALENERIINKIIQQDITLALFIYNEKIKLSNNKIEFLQNSISEQKLLQYITMGILSISSLVFVYGIKQSK